jgi:hypothetical protein
MKPKPNASTPGGTVDTKSSQTTNNINSKTTKSSSINMSLQTADDMSDTDDGQWQINAKTTSYPEIHTPDTPPKLSDPFTNNMFNLLMDSNEYNETLQVQMVGESNTQPTRKEREQTVKFQLPSRNNSKMNPGRGISREPQKKPSSFKLAQANTSIAKPAATNIGNPIEHMKN